MEDVEEDEGGVVPEIVAERVGGQTVETLKELSSCRREEKPRKLGCGNKLKQEVRGRI